MKKALALISAIALVATAAFADTPKPKTSVSLSGGFSVIGANGDKTTDTTSAGKTDSVLTPASLDVDSFSIKSNATFDWTNFNIATEGNYDAFNSDYTNYSYFQTYATIKDLYGFKVYYKYVTMNKKVLKNESTGGGSEIEDPQVNSGDLYVDSNYIYAEYDKLKTDGYKFYTRYDATKLFTNIGANTIGLAVQSLVNTVDEAGFELNNDDLASKIVYKPGKMITSYGTSTYAAYAQGWDKAEVTLKKLFGVWSTKVDSTDGMKLRTSGIGTDLAISREGWSATDVDTNGDEARNYYLGWYKTPKTSFNVVPTTSGNSYKFSYGYNDNLKNMIVKNGKVNLENTITPVKGLEIKLDAIAYDGNLSSVPDWRDYLKGRGDVATVNYGVSESTLTSATTKVGSYVADDNLAFQVAYTADKIGTFGFGAIPRIDYKATKSVTTGAGTVYVTGLSSYASNLDGAGAYSATTVKTWAYSDATTKYQTSTPTTSAFDGYKGTSFWADANLSPVLGDKGSLYAYFDGTILNYADVTKYNTKLAAATAGSKVELTNKTGLEANIGAEALYKVSPALSLNFAAQFSGVFASDYVKATQGDTFSNLKKADKAANSATTYYADTYTEANVLADAVEAVPLTLSAKASYKLNDTVTPYVSDTYRFAAGDLANYDFATKSGSLLKDAVGYFDQNTVEIGANLTPSKKATLGLAVKLYQYLGTPEASDLYVDGVDKKAADAAYSTIVANENNQFKLIASFAYKY